jgi:CheY-like chemotaxis protein
MTTFPENRPVEPAGRRERVDILLIDDDAAIRTMLTETLQRHGYSLRAAADGKAAMGFLSRHDFRLIITDIFMPRMDGIEVILKHNAIHPEVPILAISGGSAFGGPDNMLKPAAYLGCRQTLAKPFEMGVFLATVEQLIGPV